MHERSVATTLIRKVVAIQSEQKANRVLGIKVTVGEFSGVDADLLRSAIEDLCLSRGYGTWDVAIERVTLQARCLPCDKAFPVVEFRFECPACHDRQVCIEQGEEMLLESVTLEMADE